MSDAAVTAQAGSHRNGRSALQGTAEQRTAVQWQECSAPQSSGRRA
jgi:hypothetical protein